MRHFTFILDSYAKRKLCQSKTAKPFTLVVGRKERPVPLLMQGGVFHGEENYQDGKTANSCR